MNWGMCDGSRNVLHRPRYLPVPVPVLKRDERHLSAGTSGKYTGNEPN